VSFELSERASRRHSHHGGARPHHPNEHRPWTHGLSRSTIYRKIAEGTFPAQLKIRTSGAGWRESDIDRWIANPVAWRPEEEVGHGRR